MAPDSVREIVARVAATNMRFINTAGIADKVEETDHELFLKDSFDLQDWSWLPIAKGGQEQAADECKLIARRTADILDNTADGI